MAATGRPAARPAQPTEGSRARRGSLCHIQVVKERREISSRKNKKARRTFRCKAGL